jgi:hypothetical protein
MCNNVDLIVTQRPEEISSIEDGFSYLCAFVQSQDESATNALLMNIWNIHPG